MRRTTIGCIAMVVLSGTIPTLVLAGCGDDDEGPPADEPGDVDTEGWFDTRDPVTDRQFRCYLPYGEVDSPMYCYEPEEGP